MVVSSPWLYYDSVNSACGFKIQGGCLLIDTGGMQSIRAGSCTTTSRSFSRFDGSGSESVIMLKSAHRKVSQKL